MYSNVFKNYWTYIFLLASSIFIIWPNFLPGYFSHHDDLQVMRIFEMRRCILDWQIPCRWVPDMGYGNGYPLFNYYAVLPYYMGAVLSFFVDFITTAKILFLIPLVLSGVSMYIFAKEFGSKFASLTSAILYMFAPFKALDSYVRGAVAESFAMAIIPLVFYFGLKVIKNGSIKFWLGLAVSLALFLTSHNIMTILFAPVILSLFGLWIFKEKGKNLKKLVLGILLGLGLSAFFILPAYLEKDLVQIDNLTRLDLDFRAHFVTLNQLFLDREWGYGASKPGAQDTISFQIGWPHWWIVVISALFIVIRLIKNKKLADFDFYLVLGTIFLFAIFMTHGRSVFAWEAIPILKFVQFPWRFLAVAVFSVSLMAVLFIKYLPSEIQKYVSLMLIIVTILFNLSYFQPKTFDPNLTDQEKLSGDLWETQQKAAILDYLPKTALEPREKAPNGPILRFGEADFQDFNLKSNSFRFKAKVSSPSEIEIPIFDFPNWTVSVNGKRIEHSNKNYLGRIELRLNPGNYLVFGKFEDTLIRRISNIISLFSILLIIVIPIYGKIRKADH